MTDKFESGPVMDAIPPESMQDAAPKRRRGRPPKDPNAPKRSYTPRSRANLKEQIGGMLVMLNVPLMAFPFTRNDALDARELELLTEAIDNQCKISPTFRKYVLAATSATQGGQMVSVVAIIAARRMARHEFLLPREVDTALGSMLGAVPNMPMTPDGPGYASDVASTVPTNDAAK